MFTKLPLSPQNYPPDLYNPPKGIPIKPLQQNYIILNNLGTGSFGDVLLAKLINHNPHVPSTNHSGTLLENKERCHFSGLVAIKVINKRAPVLQEYYKNKEIIFILSMPPHPNLVHIHDLFIDKKHLKLHIVMESLNQNLYQLMNARKHLPFRDSTLKSIISQVLDGIRHIHHNNFFHRDIKPENILVIPTIQYYGKKSLIPPHRKHDSYIVKVADYGLSRSINNLSPYTSYISTRWYRSPEILLRRKWYSKPVDIWAFGVLVVELINFVPLFPGISEIDQLARILSVLGCPSLPEVNMNIHPHYFIPLGGFWREARTLAHKLGIYLPYEPGCYLQQLVPDSTKTELLEIIKACLTWDPDIRANADVLCSMDYFKSTNIYHPYNDYNVDIKYLEKPNTLFTIDNLLDEENLDLDDLSLENDFDMSIKC